MSTTAQSHLVKIMEPAMMPILHELVFVHLDSLVQIAPLVKSLIKFSIFKKGCFRFLRRENVLISFSFWKIATTSYCERKSKLWFSFGLREYYFNLDVCPFPFFPFFLFPFPFFPFSLFSLFPFFPFSLFPFFPFFSFFSKEITKIKP